MISKLLQYSNALEPILVNVDGNVTLVRFVQPLNVEL